MLAKERGNNMTIDAIFELQFIFIVHPQSSYNILDATPSIY